MSIDLDITGPAGAWVVMIVLGVVVLYVGAIAFIYWRIER